MSIKKKLLSYIWPIKTKVHSSINGVLEVTWNNGRKVLDSKNTNYSFGSLQRILEFGLSKIDLQKVDTVLLLGLGGGSIIASLQNKLAYAGKIHAIEIDPQIITLAATEFHIHASENLTIEKADAFDFVTKSQSLFDLIIIDVFVDNSIPSSFYSKNFFENVAHRMTKHGTVLFNLGLNTINQEDNNSLIDFWKMKVEYKTTVLNRVDRTNTLLLLQRL
jgi:spermidine synthase